MLPNRQPPLLQTISMVSTDILADPAWFPACLDPKNGVVEFVRTDRADLSRASFLDNRWDRAGREQNSVPVDDLRVAFSNLADPPQLNFIWHTAFCCSTVISRALDVPERNLSLKEPDVLTTLADVKRAMKDTGGLPPYLPQAVFALLARRSRRGEAILVKPSNVANFLLPEAARITQGRALMLYSDCATFLASVIDRGEDRRAHIRRVFEKIVRDQISGNRRWSVEKLFPLTDLQIAALSWHLQISELASAMSSSWANRAASLDCDAFLAEPAKTLAEIDRFLVLGLGQEHIADVVDETLLMRDAKGERETPFDISKRRNQWNALGRQSQREIESVVTWSCEAFKASATEPPLPRPLMQLEKKYLPQ